MRYVLLFTVLLAAILPAMQASAQDTTNPEISQQLQAAVEAAVAAGDPGVVARIDTPAGYIESAAGFADVDAAIAMQPDDSFRMGSTTKTLTATVVLQLSEEGILSLDDTLDTWLPEIAATLPYGDQITLRQMLSHTSGIFDWDEDPIIIEQFAQDAELRAHQWLPEELVAIAATHPADFAPGESYSYCNTGYTLLGMVIEAATGKSLAENYRSRILDPLNMSHSYLSDFEEPTSQLVRGYSTLLGTDDYNASFAFGAGGLVSNAEDITVFFRALLSGKLFRDPATLETMLTMSEQSIAHLAIVQDDTPYGLGIRKFETPFGDGYGHGGDTFGYKTLTVYFPELDTALVMFTNTEGTHLDPGTVLMIAAELLGLAS